MTFKLYMVDDDWLPATWWINLRGAITVGDSTKRDALIEEFGGEFKTWKNGQCAHIVFQSEEDVVQFLLKWG